MAKSGHTRQSETGWQNFGGYGLASETQPETIAGGVPKRQEIIDELCRLGQDIATHGAVVCTTHMCFIPCRKRDGCVISEDPEDVARVSVYQRGA